MYLENLEFRNRSFTALNGYLLTLYKVYRVCNFIRNLTAKPIIYCGAADNLINFRLARKRGKFPEGSPAHKFENIQTTLP